MLYIILCILFIIAVIYVINREFKKQNQFEKKIKVMDEFTCSELLEELLVRFKQTNGIGFCNPEALGQVAGFILAQENVWEPVDECSFVNPFD